MIKKLLAFIRIFNPFQDCLDYTINELRIVAKELDLITQQDKAAQIDSYTKLLLHYEYSGIEEFKVDEKSLIETDFFKRRFYEKR